MTTDTIKPKRLNPAMECRVCGETIAKAQIKRHLNKCLSEGTARPRETLLPTLRLTISQSIYQLQVAVRVDATLDDLDNFLRDVWMECCGHMSLFMAKPKDARRVIYTAHPEGDEEDEEQLEDEIADQLGLTPAQREVMRLAPRHWPTEKPLDIPVQDALKHCPTLTYEYDMGTTTRCTVTFDKEISLSWPTRKSASKIRLLARNARPDWVCSECGEPATKQCTLNDCWQGGYLKLCDKHAKTHARQNHPDDDWTIEPLSNSPRDPSCGYVEGPKDEEKYVWK